MVSLRPAHWAHNDGKAWFTHVEQLLDSLVGDNLALQRRVDELESQVAAAADVQRQRRLVATATAPVVAAATAVDVAPAALAMTMDQQIWAQPIEDRAGGLQLAALPRPIWSANPAHGLPLGPAEPCRHNPSQFLLPMSACWDAMMDYTTGAADLVPGSEKDKLWSVCHRLSSMFDIDESLIYRHLQERPELRLEMHNPKGGSDAYYLRFACTHCGKHTGQFMPQQWDSRLCDLGKASSELKRQYVSCLNHTLQINLRETTCRHRTGTGKTGWGAGTPLGCGQPPPPPFPPGVSNSSASSSASHVS